MLSLKKRKRYFYNKEVKGNEESKTKNAMMYAKPPFPCIDGRRDAPNVLVRSIHTSPDTFVFNLL